MLLKVRYEMEKVQTRLIVGAQRLFLNFGRLVENRDGGETELRVCLFRGDTKYRPDTRLVQSSQSRLIPLRRFSLQSRLPWSNSQANDPRQALNKWDNSRSSICCHSNKNETRTASPAALAVIRLDSGLPCAITAAIGAYHTDSPCHWMLRMQRTRKLALGREDEPNEAHWKY
ncbi:hypothetical protein CBS115989_10312 [Aspergillus niger]|nr:hypothetical protein CBS115989_10312 [Aspergillus niger]KAI2836436.1 hypothetical protein CBS11232_10185 [Aspergillus niger]